MSDARSADDLRSRRTRRAIVEAYLKLCAEGWGESCSVASIAERAGVNRATFYRHFEDRDDMAERGLGIYLGELLVGIESESGFRNLGQADGVDPRDPGQRILARVERFFSLLEERAAILRPLLSGRAGFRVFLGIEAYVSTFLRESRLDRLQGVELSIPEPFATRTLSMMILGLPSSWLEDPRGYGPRDIAKAYVAFLFNGLFAAPGDQEGERSVGISKMAFSLHSEPTEE